jgi:hypothetical protein
LSQLGFLGGRSIEPPALELGGKLEDALLKTSLRERRPADVATTPKAGSGSNDPETIRTRVRMVALT